MRVWQGGVIAALATAAAAAPAMAQQAQVPGRWQGHAGSAATGPVAILEGHPQLPIMLIRCAEGRPILLVRLGADGSGNPIEAPRLGTRLNVTLNPIGGSEATDRVVELDAIDAPREYVGALTPAALALLAGAASSLHVSVVTTHRVMGQNLPLAGSSAALRPIATTCGGVPAPAVRPTPDMPAPVAPLNIVPGHYVTETEPCSNPGFEVFYYDGRRIGLLRRDERHLSATGPARRSRGEVLLTDWGFSVRTLSPTRIQRTIQDIAAPERWCAPDQIPAAMRMR